MKKNKHLYKPQRLGISLKNLATKISQNTYKRFYFFQTEILLKIKWLSLTKI